MGRVHCPPLQMGDWGGLEGVGNSLPTHTCACTRMHMDPHPHACIHTCAHTRAHTRVHRDTYIPAHMHTRVHTHAHTHTHKHSHINTLSLTPTRIPSVPTSLSLKGKQRRSHQTHKLPPPGEGSHGMLPPEPWRHSAWAEDRPTLLGEWAGGRRCLQAHSSLGTAAVSREPALTLNSPPAVGWAQASSASAPPAGWAGEVEPHT